jgi:hypothetical protein
VRKSLELKPHCLKLKTIIMKKLIKYHTIQANPDYYWENISVAIDLKNGKIKTYDEYKSACKTNGCLCYNEQVFQDFLNNIQD